MYLDLVRDRAEIFLFFTDILPSSHDHTITTNYTFNVVLYIFFSQIVILHDVLRQQYSLCIL